MSEMLNGLDPDLQEKVVELIDSCKKEGIQIRLSSGLRTLDEQNKLWRRAFATKYIMQVVKDLKSKHCDYLADAIERVGIQPAGRLVTRLHGGLSWHNWGKAADFTVIDKQGYVVKIAEHPILKDFGEVVKAVGLRWGGDFKSTDPLHVQLNHKEVPSVYTINQINEHFKNIKA
jgi:peptidoglycan L-alanyl-D-glutamate endopeptidase CwlK